MIRMPCPEFMCGMAMCSSYVCPECKFVQRVRVFLEAVTRVLYECHVRTLAPGDVCFRQISCLALSLVQGQAAMANARGRKSTDDMATFGEMSGRTRWCGGVGLTPLWRQTLTRRYPMTEDNGLSKDLAASPGWDASRSDKKWKTPFFAETTKENA